MSALPFLRLKNVDIDFPIYQGADRLFRKAVMQSAVGGLLGQSGSDGRIVVRALSDVNIEVRSGDRLALLGHNGAGKTTLLRCMAGIYHPTAGTLSHSGSRVPLFDIGLGFDPEANGYENIVLRGLLMGLKRAEIERKVDDVANFSGLGGFLNLPVRTYSSGMALRLLFSIATSVDPDILLMDEWIATGDKAFIDRADKRLRELVDRSHILVLASHNLSLLESCCNRAILMKGGKVVFDGSVREGIARYHEISSNAPAKVDPAA
jgi:ABC-type polysaccharide/polyol phosphate transport system ATPase subunit